MLVAETHFTAKTYFKIEKYLTYHTNHPDGTAHAGSALLIKENLKHYVTNPYCSHEIQATNIVIECANGPLLVSALYMPPKHNLKSDSYSKFFKTLGPKFIAGGDYNAKHTDWGSRIITAKGRELNKTVQELKLKVASTGEPTYWPSDIKKKPDLVDFFVTKGLSTMSLDCKSSFELSSDHSPILADLNCEGIEVKKPCKLHNRRTDWIQFRKLIENTLVTQIPLKTEDDLTEAVEIFNKCVQSAAWEATPNSGTSASSDPISMYPHVISDIVQEKRQARKRWQETKHPNHKTIFNKLTKKLKNILSKIKNQNMEKNLMSLDATPATDYSLWKTTKNLKRPIPFQSPLRRNDGTWAKSDEDKAKLFAEHLSGVFTPNLDMGSSKTKEIIDGLSEAYELENEDFKEVTQSEVKSIIRKLDINKAPGYDLITAKIMKELPDIGVKFLTQVYNAILRCKFVPAQWKVAEIILILKPGKEPDKVASYRPISLLPIASKVLEILILKRLTPEIVKSKLIPEHQFGFREAHGTIEQVHRLVNNINHAFEHKKYCSAAFLDISQAFDRVWHEGLLFKIKRSLPVRLFLLLESYLHQRHFYVKHGEDKSGLYNIEAGVPQGSVLGPILYLIYTSDLPVSNGVLVGTFADDTALMATHEHPTTASALLQSSLNEISKWMTDWRIKANETKSVHVTFALRHGSCPPVKLNSIQIPDCDVVRYLGIHMDRRLTWKKHIFTKRKALSQQLRKLYWLMTRKSKLSLENKLLLYKCILKPIWSYGVELWGTAANSNIEIIQRFQSKMLRMIANAPWYITNCQLHRDLKVPMVKEEIKTKLTSYAKRMQHHPNLLATKLMDKSNRIFKRIKRRAPQDLI